VVGFIDDNPALVGKRIDGIKVFSFEEAFESRFLTRNRVTRVVWSIQSALETSFHQVGEACLTHNLLFQRVPNVHDWIDGCLSSNQLRRVKIEDLLNRTPIKLDNENVTNFLRGKKVLVTGAAGSIGSEIARQVLHYAPEQLILVDNGETAMYDLLMDFHRKMGERKEMISFMGDVTRENRMEEIFNLCKPDVVFHAAAYKHVPLMENDNVSEALNNNVLGTYTLAQACKQAKVDKFVLISTDKAVNPTNVMGATKRLAEMVCQGLQEENGTRFVMVRFGNVLGSSGSVIPKFREQINAGGPITVTHPEITRYFMSIPEASQLVIQAGLMGGGGQIFVLDMGEPVRIVDLARDMIKLSGFQEDEIAIEFSGLRPGEKLFEELLADDENTLPTPHEKLRIASARLVDIAWVNSMLEWVETIVVKDETIVKQELKGWVVEYTPDLEAH
jgi:FlaA1/EpsC-like NDP-sugar epimerase